MWSWEVAGLALCGNDLSLSQCIVMCLGLWDQAVGSEGGGGGGRDLPYYRVDIMCTRVLRGTIMCVSDSLSQGC